MILTHIFHQTFYVETMMSNKTKVLNNINQNTFIKTSKEKEKKNFDCLFKRNVKKKGKTFATHLGVKVGKVCFHLSIILQKKIIYRNNSMLLLSLLKTFQYIYALHKSYFLPFNISHMKTVQWKTFIELYENKIKKKFFIICTCSQHKFLRQQMFNKIIESRFRSGK